jgi:hypothetical protein
MPRKPRNTPKAPASRPTGKEVELEEYAQLFFKYTVFIEEQSAAIRHLPKEIYEAHAIVLKEHNEQQRHASIARRCEPSLEGLHDTLKYFGSLCEIAPQTILELS